MKKLFLLGLISCLFLSCEKEHKIEKVERAFYYWKSSENWFNAKEMEMMDSLKIRKIYLKFFEVKHDETLGNIPISKNQFYDVSWYGERKKIDSVAIVPTVFIKNDVFIKSSRQEIDTLVSNVNHLVSKYYKDRFNRYPAFTEIQIDCDWTLKSKDNYFYFLKELTKLSKKELSCTLRLYPYKYRTKMGIPPVKRATLMCYNLIQPFADKTKNSILDNKELESYLNVDGQYPIHLDVALPIFSWAHHYQYDEFKSFVNISEDFIKAACERKSGLWFEIKKDTSFNDVYFRVGDKIKYENVTQNQVNDAISELKKKVKFDAKTTVTLFHLDSTITKKYNYETLTRFYTSFSK
ncbi:hypothetical protein [Flavobacterium terrisoli]|uniref:hypothetical protein n=1 Tax=Flavobacterium terrisoli TaxID=3242195 RepID=UPI0025431F3F|nr:hypothetical protein [Flavobacterium buctense]